MQSERRRASSRPSASTWHHVAKIGRLRFAIILQMHQQRKVLVVGAGLGGLTLARCLQGAGVPVALYERAPELKPRIGSGIGLTYGKRNLEKLGFGPQLSKICAPYSEVQMHGVDGHLGTISLPQVPDEHGGGSFAWGVRRSKLVAMLEASLEPGVLHLEHELVDLAGGSGGIKAKFSNGVEVEGAIVIGCDGLRSKVRELMHGPTVPRDTGAAIWYCSTEWRPDSPHVFEQSRLVFGELGGGRHGLCFPMGSGDERETVWGLSHPVTRSKSTDNWEGGGLGRISALL
jgi:salicylate hydroxylase